MATVLVNADVRPMVKYGGRAEALAFADGQILAVGSQQEVLAIAGEPTEVWDVHGATVIPGLIDSHHHASVASLYSAQVRLSPPMVRDIPSLQQVLATASETLAPGRWLVALDWDEVRLLERRPPTREELDEAVPDRPLMAMHYTCHRILANSQALRLAGIDRHTPDPVGGIIVRGRNREPTGLLIEQGMCRVESLARADLVAHDAEGYLERLAAHYQKLVAVGITHLVDAAVPPELMMLYRVAEQRGLLPIPTTVMPVSTGGWLEPPWDILDGPKTGEKEGTLKVGPIKLVFDGAPACSMCLGFWQSLGVMFRTWALALRRRTWEPMRTSLSIQPRIGQDLKLRSGITMYRESDAHKMVKAATEQGFAVATHAIGNAAVDIALSAYTAAGSSLHQAGVPRLEHAWYLQREQVKRIADLGAAVVTMPFMLTMPAYGNAVEIPDLRAMPLRWLLDADVLVAASSDFPVVGFDPLAGVRSAVTRMTAAGEVFEADQCVSLEEALSMYTRSAAQVAGCLDTRGTLAPGKRADLVILDGHLDDVAYLPSVKTTLICGQKVYEKGS